ncbi:MAG: hypothetical protein WKF84_19530 [Pyrinomonadaceae bacterium]
MSIPTIAAAIDARVLSSLKEERVAASSEIQGPHIEPFAGGNDRAPLVAAVHDALYASKVCSYAQGMNLIRAGSEEYNWDISLREMARIWKGGCIIRARFLDTIMRAYERRPDLPNLLLDDDFKTSVGRSQEGVAPGCGDGARSRHHPSLRCLRLSPTLTVTARRVSRRT